MKKIILLFIFCFNISLFFGQYSCGTKETPDHTLDFSKYENYMQQAKLGNANRTITYIPVKFFIVRSDSGTGGADIVDLVNELDLVNDYYKFADIEFYQCGPEEYIDDSYFLNLSYASEDTLEDTYNEANVINIYFAPTVRNGSGNTICGFANFPWSSDDLIVMDNSCATNSSTLAHEIGHYFGVYHTHSSVGGNELVARTNCSTTGDQLCDTPADPSLSGNVDFLCAYTGTGTDANGDTYTPSTSNIMSYSRKSCRTNFTAEQGARMNFYLNGSRSYLACPQFASVNEKELDLLKIFPNPTKNILSVNSKIPLSKVQIIDLSGKTIISNTLNNELVYSISLNGIKNGSYILRATRQNGKEIQKLFIKN